MSLHILGISGSLRRGSYNTALLRAANAVLPAHTTLEIADISQLPMLNPDDLPESPAVVQQFLQHIRAADALLIASPEYNYSFTAPLKNAIDWATCTNDPSPLSGKPVAIIGAAGRFGTVRSQLHLRQVLVETNCHTLNKPELLVSAPWDKFDASGQLIDPQTCQQLQELLVALVAWTRRLMAE
jgi:chromate reductase, NAD(P)H dehydrogenase (quinone)